MFRSKEPGLLVHLERQFGGRQTCNSDWTRLPRKDNRFAELEGEGAVQTERRQCGR